MPLHLVKLCVGVDSIADLEARVAARRDGAAGHGPTTRVAPTRLGEIVDGGSLFWVIKGYLCVRQRFLGVEAFTAEGGVRRHHLHLEADLVPVLPRPMRPFQGWRYLREDDRPPDLADGGAEAAAMPEHLRYALRELCLL